MIAQSGWTRSSSIETHSSCCIAFGRSCSRNNGGIFTCGAPNRRIGGSSPRRRRAIHQVSPRLAMTRFAQRRDKLRRLLKKNEADSLLVTCFTNVAYLTGFTGDDSYLLVRQHGDLLVSDMRYTT